MVVAILTAKRAEIAGVSDSFGLLEWTYLVLLAWLALSGPGRFSLDGLRAVRAKPGPSPTYSGRRDSRALNLKHFVFTQPKDKRS